MVDALVLHSGCMEETLKATSKKQHGTCWTGGRHNRTVMTAINDALFVADPGLHEASRFVKKKMQIIFMC